MDATASQITSYFHAVQTLANLQDCRFTDRTPYTTVSSDDLTAGRLDEATVDEIFALAEAEDDDTVDVIISLVTLENGSDADGLVLIAAQVDENGRLTGDLASQLPWTPASRLRSPGVMDRQLMVGTLADFWTWRLSEGSRRVSQAEDWADVIGYAKAMAAEVLDDDLIGHGLTAELPADSDRPGSNVNESILKLHRPGHEPHRCWIAPGAVINANTAILDLYRHLAQTDRAPRLYERMLDLKPRERESADDIDDRRAVLLESALLSGGSMSDEHPLTPSQRRAVHAFLHDGTGDVTAVSGPPGTGKTTMLQSVVASLIVQHSLDDRPAPLIIGTSTNNQAVTNIIDSFSSVAPDDSGLLARRWLPAASSDGAADAVLQGLAVYAPSQKKTEAARKKGYLLENSRKGGVYTEYSTSEYQEAATPRFLGEMAAYATAVKFPVPDDLDAADALLAEVLRLCDEYRRHILRARCEADALMPAGASLGGYAGTADLTRDLAFHQERLACWRSLADDGRTGLLDVARNRTGEKPGDRDLDAVEDYVALHTERVVELAGMLDRHQRESAVRASASEEAARAYLRAAGERIDALAELCLLDDDQAEKLRAADSLLTLDQALDVTVRHTLFWLAVHRYEAKWLIGCAGKDLVPPEDRYRTTWRYMDRYWRHAASLTPCFVMTAYQLPKYFRLWTQSGEKPDYDLERADLLIVDEAGQVDTSLGSAAFALAKRALVVGDVKQLAPVWGIDPESDRVMAESFGLGSVWETVERRGLTSSDHSSVMMAAAEASGWCHGQDDDSGLFLAEHFRCRSEIIEYCNELLYKGQLIPSRPTGGYALEGLVPHPFLFREVTGSEDRRRGSSRVNQAEADAIAEWIDEHWEFFCSAYGVLDDLDGQKSVFGVVTPFAAQANVISQAIRRVLGPKRANRVTVGTAHTLQGAERRVVLFSAVYGDNAGQAPFIDSTLELMNVAVSRAKDLFIAFGAKARWNDGGPVFSLVRAMAVKDGCRFGATAEQDTEAPAASPESEHSVPESPASPAVRAAGESANPLEHDESAVDGDAGSKAAQSETEEREAVVASVMLKSWREQDDVPADIELSARKLNQALHAVGLLRKEDQGWAPTDEGARLGIISYSGESSRGPFVNVKYSSAAQAALKAMILSGELPMA